MLNFDNLVPPMMSWLQLHPILALFITFFVAMLESLAIVGSIIPGSITMTGIGILAGTGAMRIDLTLFAATCGAILGDSLSYFAGYIYHERLFLLWPFRNYPDWLRYGKHYFEKHGGKSVIIGRFVGPLRSLIPVIAGMMRMNQLRFLTANVISGILWSFAYILPGVLIGTASSELSPHQATRLIFTILGLLIFFWLLGIGFRWFVQHLRYYSRLSLHHAFMVIKKRPVFSSFLEFVTPKEETHHSETAALLLGILAVLVLFFMLPYLQTLNALNSSIYLLMQSFRTQMIDNTATILMAFSDLFVLSMIISSFFILFLFCHQFKSALYLALITLLALSVPISDYKTFEHFLILLPAILTSMICILMIFFSNAIFSNLVARFVNTILYVILFSRLFGALYFGDLTLTEMFQAFLGGAFSALIACLLFRKDKASLPSRYGLRFVLFVFLVCPLFLLGLNYSTMKREHTIPERPTAMIDESIWWNQSTPLFPPYRTNRFGKPVERLNIQYAGSVEMLQNTLSNEGWVLQKRTFWFSLLTRLAGGTFSKTPLISPLYLNKPPVLIMTYQPKDGSKLQILYLWHSGYYLNLHLLPLWTGSLQVIPKENNPASLNYLNNCLSNFETREVFNNNAALLLIRPKVTED